MHEKDQLDLLLDSALSTYADPPAGLEDRVLSALDATRIRTHRGRLAWTIALPAAACVLLQWLSTPKTIHAPSIPDQHAQHTNSSSSSSILHKHPSHPSHSIAHPPLSSTQPTTAQAASKTPLLPKLDVFPTPRPLTTEECSLALVATQAPASLRQALLDAQADDIPPLHIASTHIPPLDAPDQGQP